MVCEWFLNGFNGVLKVLQWLFKGLLIVVNGCLICWMVFNGFFKGSLKVFLILFLVAVCVCNSFLMVV